MRTWPYQRLTGRLEAASALPRGDLQGEGGIGGSEATDAAQMLGTSSAEDSRHCRTTQQSNEQSGVRDEKNVKAMCCVTRSSLRIIRIRSIKPAKPNPHPTGPF